MNYFYCINYPDHAFFTEVIKPHIWGLVSTEWETSEYIDM